MPEGYLYRARTQFEPAPPLSVGTGSLALSLGLCLCAGQLVATPAASAATAAAAPVTAAAAAKKKPSVRTTFSTRAIKSGASFKVTVKYLNPANGAKASPPVRYGCRPTAPVNGSTGVPKNLGAAGSVTFTAAPKITGLFRTYYTGNGTSPPSPAGSPRSTCVKPASNKSAKILAEANRHVGALYLYGASGPKRFDCSGFTMYVYRKTIGAKLPHKANSQQKYGKAVAKTRRSRATCLFRSGSYGYHAGIYAGDGYMYDSPHTGTRVSKHKMFGSNYVVRRSGLTPLPEAARRGFRAAPRFRFPIPYEDARLPRQAVPLGVPSPSPRPFRPDRFFALPRQAVPLRVPSPSPRPFRPDRCFFALPRRAPPHAPSRRAPRSAIPTRATPRAAPWPQTPNLDEVVAPLPAKSHQDSRCGGRRAALRRPGGY